MKRKRIVAVIIAAIVALAVLACTAGNHAATTDEWSHDATGHWHACAEKDCTEKFDSADHEWNDGEVTEQPTCTKKGKKTFTCTVCGETKVEDVNMTAHTWDDGTVTEEATCIKKGVKTFECSVCHTTKDEDIAMTDHNPSEEWDKGDNENHWHACLTEDCDAKFDTEAHDWDDGEVTEDPTCTKLGTKTFTCNDCGATKTEDVDMLDHDVVDRTAYESDDEFHWNTCENCTTHVDEIAHDFDEGEIELSNSRVKFTCETCGKIVYKTDFIYAPKAIKLGSANLASNPDYAKATLDYTLYLDGEESNENVAVTVADPTVVSYDDGTLTALKEGTTKLTLTFDELTAEVNVTVGKEFAFISDMENVSATTTGNKEVTIKKEARPINDFTISMPVASTAVKVKANEIAAKAELERLHSLGYREVSWQIEMWISGGAWWGDNVFTVSANWANWSVKKDALVVDKMQYVLPFTVKFSLKDLIDNYDAAAGELFRVQLNQTAGNEFKICFTSFELTTDHDWKNVKDFDDDNHWTECAVCGEKKDIASHNASDDWTHDTTNHWHACPDCDVQADLSACAAAENAEWEKDDDNHWHLCEVCDNVLDEAVHTFGSGVVDSENHRAVFTCTTCGFERYETDFIDAPKSMILGSPEITGAPDIELPLDYTLYLNGEVSDEEVNVEIADPTVVSYSGGNVTALKEGTTTLTVSYDDLSVEVSIKVEKHILHTFSAASDSKFVGDIREMNNLYDTTSYSWTGGAAYQAKVTTKNDKACSYITYASYFYNPGIWFSLDLTKEDLQHYKELGYTKIAIPYLKSYNISLTYKIGTESQSTSAAVNTWSELEYSIDVFIDNYDTFVVNGAKIIIVTGNWSSNPESTGSESHSWQFYMGDIYLK